MALSIEKQIENKVITLVGNSARRWGDESVDKGASYVVVRCGQPDSFIYGEAGETLAVKVKVDVFCVTYSSDDLNQSALDTLYESITATLEGLTVSSFSGLSGITVQSVTFGGGDYTIEEKNRIKSIGIELTIEL